MTYYALIVVVFLMSGEPQMFAKLLGPGETCDEAVAVAFMKEQAKEPYQDLTLWNCLDVNSPGPMKPALYDGQTEAAK